jgi:hypothetical protein
VGWSRAEMRHWTTISVDVQFLRDVLAAHLDFGLVLSDGGKVVGELHSQQLSRPFAVFAVEDWASEAVAGG